VDGSVVAAMHVDVWGVVEDLRRVILSATPVPEALLRDPDVPLGELAQGPIGAAGVAAR
jgi:hypothetical protein